MRIEDVKEAEKSLKNNPEDFDNLNNNNNNSKNSHNGKEKLVDKLVDADDDEILTLDKKSSSSSVDRLLDKEDDEEDGKTLEKDETDVHLLEEEAGGSLPVFLLRTLGSTPFAWPFYIST
jgi:hypothetical protein